MARAKGSGCFTFLVIGIAVFLVGLKSCGDEKAPTLTASANRADGVAVCLLIDVSGSMDASVPNAAGKKEQKLAIAKRAAVEVCRAVAKYAEEDKSRTIRIGVASFSDDYELDMPIDKPDMAKLERAINGLDTRGGTAIGTAVVEAQRSLDATGLKRQHIIVLTDGENRSGPSPERVADAINKLPEELRPTTYVVAFDVSANVFSQVKEKGWQVFSAANGEQLAKQLDEVVGGHILIEK